MDSASYIAAAGLKAAFQRLEVATHNLANINSPGYKADKPFFRMLSEAADRLSGSSLAGTLTDFSNGSLKKTGNPLDLAINGDGFFSVRTPGGIRYTRNGSFTIAQGGELITQEGYPVLSNQGGTIVIALGPGTANKVSVSSTGDVSVDGNRVGTIGVFRFADTRALLKEGSQTFTSAEVPQEVINPNIEQGAVEESNVNVIASLLDLIEINRIYEVNQKTVQTLMNTINRRAISDITA